MHPNPAHFPVLLYLYSTLIASPQEKKREKQRRNFLLAPLDNSHPSVSQPVLSHSSQSQSLQFRHPRTARLPHFSWPARPAPSFLLPLPPSCALVMVALGAAVHHTVYTFVQTAFLTDVRCTEFWSGSRHLTPATLSILVLPEILDTLLMPRVLEALWLWLPAGPAPPQAPAVHGWVGVPPHPSNPPKLWDSVWQSQRQPKVLVDLSVVWGQG